MSARPEMKDWPERDQIQLTATLLEKRAALARQVVISDQLALVIAKQLRRLLERGG